MNNKPANVIQQRQQDWARNHNPQIGLDKDGYCTEERANLFQELSACTRRELKEGDGSELGKPGKRGKFQALHSSSALVCNVFDYWRGRDLGALADALGIKARPCGMSFEEKFKTGIGSRSPNLDVVFYLSNGGYFAIESKFTEPLTKSKAHSLIKEKYFAGDTKHWANRGLPVTQRLADDMRKDRKAFAYLDAAQLLKHMLGLATTGSDWQLHYLWFDAGEPLSHEHKEEIERFAKDLGPEAAHFTSQTYQGFYNRLATSLGAEHQKYLSYLKSRYFP